MTEDTSGRPHRGVHFTCCNVYARIYLNVKGDAFVGWCPHCARRLELRVEPGGSTDQFFQAG